MRISQCSLIVAGLMLAGCGRHPAASSQAQQQSLTPEQAGEVDAGVRAFAQTVAHDVTQDGPIAWQKHFADSPAFFMAVGGAMAFPNRAAATAALPDIARAIAHIQLQWGDDLRVDPLTANLAVMGASWREVVTDPAGHSMDEEGYFTGITEYRNGRWQFRDAHWSVAAPAH